MVKAAFDFEGSMMAGMMVPFLQQYFTFPNVVSFVLSTGRSRMTGFGEQLAALLTSKLV
jgi:hypothetical protein